MYVGNADGIVCEAVYGWAADRLRPSVPITVAVYVDGIRVEDVLASMHRQDVANWLQSLGFPDNGNHGFAVLWPVRDGRQHTVSVKFEQSSVLSLAAAQEAQLANRSNNEDSRSSRHS
jgi:hypothetical protein